MSVHRAVFWTRVENFAIFTITSRVFGIPIKQICSLKSRLSFGSICSVRILYIFQVITNLLNPDSRPVLAWWSKRQNYSNVGAGRSWWVAPKWNIPYSRQFGSFFCCYNMVNYLSVRHVALNSIYRWKFNTVYWTRLDSILRPTFFIQLDNRLFFKFESSKLNLVKMVGNRENSKDFFIIILPMKLILAYLASKIKKTKNLYSHDVKIG